MGDFNTVMDDTVPPVVHPQCRATVPLREQIRNKLEKMVNKASLHQSAAHGLGIKCVRGGKTKGAAYIP